MGSMKRKRRKKLAKDWAEFQGRHELTDRDAKLARATGYPPARMEQMLADADFGQGVTVSQKIREIHGRWQEELARRKEAIQDGSIKPKKKKKVERFDPQWAQAKKACRLNMDDIGKAKELGLNPRTLMKNVPSPTQRWKAPVKVWIQELYEKRQQREAAKTASGTVRADRGERKYGQREYN
jgi:hypothetical protein